MPESDGNDSVAGYTGDSLEFLRKNDVAVKDTVMIVTNNGDNEEEEEEEIQAVVMPRYEYCDDRHITVKLKSGYNVGLLIDTIESISRVRLDDVKKTVKKDNRTRDRPEMPKVLLLTTGGTIASKVDYRTGAVIPVLTADELIESVPELSDIADIHAQVLFSEYSENILPRHWLNIAYSINEEDMNYYTGIVVAHGTDTMHYTSSYLSFALAGCPIPIALVGAQRSSDRASTDAALNLIGAVKFVVESKERGVYVVMHKDGNDGVIACHAGTRVRKNHTSKRGAFETVGGKPAYLVEVGNSNGNDNNITVHKNTQKEFFADAQYQPRIKLDENVALIKYYPGYKPEMLQSVVDSGCKAIIFEGTGLGHIGSNMYDAVANARKQGVFMGMTSQCIDGKVRMTVYESGRDLLGLGVVPLGNMLPETALVKAMWAAAVATTEGNADNRMEIQDIMLREIASEFS